MQPTVSWSAVRIACGLASVIAAPFLFAQASGERLDIRTGSWEITARTTISGSPPWSQELRDKLTPEQRAELEAAFAENAGKPPRTEVTRQCITERDLEQPFRSNAEGCVQTIVRTSRTQQEVKLECTGEYKGAGTMRITASSPERMSAALDVRAGEGANVMRVQSQMEGRWLSPECEEQAEEHEEFDDELDDFDPAEEDALPPDAYDEPEDEFDGQDSAA